MGIQIQRVYTREAGGALPQNSPSNFTYQLVVEGTVDAGDALAVYLLTNVCRDLGTGAPPPAAANMMAGAGPLAQPQTTPTLNAQGEGTRWVQPVANGRFELVVSIPISVPAAQQAGLTNHLFKYYVSLVNNAKPGDADADESDILMLH